MNPFAAWFWAPFIAVQFLTRLPITFVPPRAYEGSGAKQRPLVFFPAVGIVTGGLVGAVMLAFRALGLPDLASAALALGAGALFTGCFHEDGVADTADAMGTYSRDDALRVMKDSRIGTFGGVALWVLLTAKAALLTALPTGVVPILIAAHALARWSSLPIALALPYAREGGGLGSQMADAVRGGEVILGTIVMTGVVLAAVGFDRGLVFFGAAIAVCGISAVFFKARFGGITGDCLGAANQLVELVILIAAVALRPHI